MYEIEFYENSEGFSEIKEYIMQLRVASEFNKDSRINFNKIVAYFDLLQEMGTRIGEPVTKHLEGQIWELRPLRNRFLYAYYENNKFIVLHHFIKKTQKTPKRELQIAQRRLKEYLERSNSDGNMERN